MATIGGLNDPAQMAEIIASGKADVVYMARALRADPFLPNKVMANKGEDIVRCLTCMAERAATSTRRCTVNPLIGRECKGDEVCSAPMSKNVLVVGGDLVVCTPLTLPRGGATMLSCSRRRANWAAS